MAKTFEGKVGLITGAASGLGRASALAFTREGAKVIVNDIEVQGGEETVQMIKKAGGEAIFVKADVTKEAEVKILLSRTIEAYGRLDFAFNNAGIIEEGQPSVMDLTEEQWDHVMHVNLKGIWLCMKYELMYMTTHGGGAIVNTSSIAGLMGCPNASLYAASKWGVVGLTRSAAIEYAKAGIRINLLCPGGMHGTGMIHTGMFDRTPPELHTKLLASVPMGRDGSPEEVAEVAVWLCSDAASYVTGHTMVVDGASTA